MLRIACLVRRSPRLVPAARSYANILPKSKESESPNLGFHPDLIKDKSFARHDHPERPGSVFSKKNPPKVLNTRVAMCDGGGGELGHPRVFIRLDNSSHVDPSPCGYCGDRFIRLKNIPPGHVARRAYVPTSQDDESDEEI